ncbi:unnamed protein product [Adineta steineri]|uniref:Transmembrane protein n=1 Tax=Adineta steineri TaxID=433720 RepID=A0A813V7G9_9BILA|nr:unnamed protein product [Adineta steineri]CAF1217146.1 unnamed protein product [Adineta steineri]
MLSKKGYLIHFIRIFFIGLLLSICSLLSYIWNKYQPFHLSIELQRCQSNISHINIWNWLNNFHFIQLLPSLSFLSTLTSSKCHLYIKDNYPLNINKFIGLIHSILIVYLVYYLICFSLFHSHMKHIQNRQYYYAKLYRHDQKKSTFRCSNRLLKT